MYSHFIKKINKLQFLDSYFLVLLSVLFFVVPGRRGWLDGIPLDQFHELVFLVLLVSFFIFLLPNFQKKYQSTFKIVNCVLLLLITVKIFTGIISVPRGLIGYYYYPTVENGALQKSTEFINTKISGTRIDEEINFRNTGYSFEARPFQFWFLNDYRKFSDSTIEKWVIPLTIIWKGYLYAPNLDNLKIDLSSDNKAELYLNKNEILNIQGSDQLDILKNNRHAELNILKEYKNKFIPIEIVYQRGQGTTQFLKLSIPSTYLFPQKYSEFQIYSDNVAGFIDNFIKILILIIISTILLFLISQNNWKEWFFSLRFYIFTSFLLIFYLVVKKLMNRADSEYFNFLGLGNDPLTYETFARHIQLTGNWSVSAIEASQYYYQILYYYALTTAHYLIGESLFPIIFIQIVSVLLTALLVIWICKLFIKKNSLIFLPLLFLIALNPVTIQQAFQMFPVGTLLITLVPLFLLLAENKNKTGQGWVLIYFFLAGIFLGLSVVMRNNAAALMPIIFLWFIFSFKKSFIIPFSSFFTGTMLPLMPFLVRNRLLSGQFVLISKSATTVNFIQANSVPSGYTPSEKNYDIIMNFANNFLDKRAFSSIQWILEQPLEYLRLVSQRLLYFLGFISSEATLWLSVSFILFFIGSTLFIIKPNLFSEKAKRKDYLITGGFIWTHLASIAFFAVSQQRHSVPLMPFLILFSCLLFVPLSKIFLRFSPLKYRSNYLET